MNVFSLLCVAVAAAATTRLATRLSGSTPLGIAAGLGMAATPVVWRLATHADPHTLHLAFVALIFLALVRWEAARREAAAQPETAGHPDRWLILAALLFGPAAGNHSLTLLLAVPVGLFVLAVHPRILLDPRLIATCALVLVGSLALVYLELPLRAGIFRAPLVYAKPDTWDGFWYVALAEQFRGALNEPLGDLPRKLDDLAKLAGTQLGFLTPVVLLAFLATVVRHPRYALLSGSAMVITVLFNAAYSNADIQRYYLGPVLWAWSWLAILGGVILEQVGVVAAPRDEAASPGAAARDEAPSPDTIARHGDVAPASAAPPDPDDVIRGRRAVPAGLGTTLLGAGLAALLLIPTASDFDRREFQADMHNDTAARRWLLAALSGIEPDAVVVSWWSTSTVLWYGQLVDGLRPDLTIVDDRTRLDLDYGEATDVIARFLGSRPVYVIRANAYDLGLVYEQYDLEQVGIEPALDLYRVIGRRSGG
jgi:hypothetical protein